MEKVTNVREMTTDIELVRQPHDIYCGDTDRCRHAQALSRIVSVVEAARAVANARAVPSDEWSVVTDALREALGALDS